MTRSCHMCKVCMATQEAPTLLSVPSFLTLGSANSSFMPVLALSATRAPSRGGKSFESLTVQAIPK